MNKKFSKFDGQLKILTPQQQLQVLIDNYNKTIAGSTSYGEDVNDYLNTVVNSLQKIGFILDYMNTVYHSTLSNEVKNELSDATSTNGDVDARQQPKKQTA